VAQAQVAQAQVAQAQVAQAQVALVQVAQAQVALVQVAQVQALGLDRDRPVLAVGGRLHRRLCRVQTRV
jgi:hypothetical protein